MTNNDPQVLLIADDGPDFGLGHVRRMEYLHDEIARSTDEACAILSREQHAAGMSSRGEVQPFWRRVCDVIARTGPALCVFDLKFSSWSEPWDHVVASMQPHSRTIGIDVPPEWSERFDHVIHPGVAELGLSASHANWHGGPGWVLVAREPRWSPVADPPRITVTTGSQGFERFFGWLDEKLTILTDDGLEVSWVVGKHREDQLSVLNSQGSPIAYVTDSQLTERFNDSSVVLTRFGVTAFELIARGVPTIILPGWAAAEADEVRELARAGVALVASSADKVPQLAHQLASDRNLQLRLSEKARDYFKIESPHPAAKLVSQIVSRSA
jgi:hypothetical protein